MEINPTIYSSIESPTQKTPEEEKNRADSISSITTDFNKLNSFGDNSTQELLSVVRITLINNLISEENQEK